MEHDDKYAFGIFTDNSTCNIDASYPCLEKNESIEAMKEYANHVAAPLLEQLAAKDLRIDELEKGLGVLWRIYSVWRAYGSQIYDYRRTPDDSMNVMAEHAIEANALTVTEHPLLKDQPSPLAEVARKDADYL